MCVLVAGGVAGADMMRRKDPDTALALSAGGAISSAALVGIGALVYVTNSDDTDNPSRLLKVPLHNWGAGMMDLGGLVSTIGPAFGEFYAHELWTRGMTLRLVGGIVAALGTVNLNGNPCEFQENCTPPPSQGSTPLVVLGAAIYAGGIAYDIVHARDAARAYNREHGHLAVIPTAMRGTTSTSYGIAIAGAF